MADIHIEKNHTLGLAEARKAALQWAEQAEKKFDMRCIYEEGSTFDKVSFTRSGASGTLKVSEEKFELDAKLGFLLSAFKDKIEADIVKNLDLLLAAYAPAANKTASKKSVSKKQA